jgi:phosphoribosylaminoimidazole (AIR) synthetase
MTEHYGLEWHNVIDKSIGAVSLGSLVQKPSIIYSSLISKLTGGFDINNDPIANITGVAHITGGGQPSKLGRMLEPSGNGALIDNPIPPPDIMLHVQRLRDFSDEKAYGKWHMGPGMVIATPDPEKVVLEADKQGVNAQIIGEVTEEPGILIKNMGAKQEEEFLVFGRDK